MFRLNKLTSLVKKRKRIGRGGSRGGTSGRGHNGQKSRTGKDVPVAFEGGQMPLYRRLPKRGFNNADFKRAVAIVHLKQINNLFEEDAVITKVMLVEKGLVRLKKSIKGNRRPLIKILGDGELTKKITVEADIFSQSALQAIKDCGGEARLAKEI